MNGRELHIRTAVIASALLALAACAKPAAETPVAASSVSSTTAATTAALIDATPQTPRDASPQPGADDTAAAAATTSVAAPAYEPPYPNRVDLFVPPKRQGGGAVAAAGGENSVELMGFIRVDRPRAVLAINGEIRPLAAGDSRFGVEVISIQPPHVVLQRGRQRWQATLD